MTLPRAIDRPSAGRLSQLGGATLVIKYGGAVMRHEELADGWAAEVAELRAAGAKLVVVHGGGPELSRIMERLGIASNFVDGHRVTSAEGVAAAEMVLSGRVNKRLVARLQRAGVPAVGLAGTDGGLLQVSRYRPGGQDLGYVGAVRQVRPELLHALLATGFTPVVSSTATDAEGQALNINADLVAGALAGALGAARLVFLTDVDGVAAGGARQPRLSPAQAQRLIDQGVAAGGMRPKLESALAALKAGVGAVRLVDGGAPRALHHALAGTSTGTLLAAGDGPE